MWSVVNYQRIPIKSVVYMVYMGVSKVTLFILCLEGARTLVAGSARSSRGMASAAAGMDK